MKLTKEEKLNYIRSRCYYPVQHEFDTRADFILNGTYIPSGMGIKEYHEVMNMFKEMDKLDSDEKSNVSTRTTGTDGKSYTTNYPFENNYGEYCFNRLPCGICTRTNQMCPLVSNSQPYSPFIYCNDLSTNDTSSNVKDGDIKVTM